MQNVIEKEQRLIYNRIENEIDTVLVDMTQAEIVNMVRPSNPGSSHPPGYQMNDCGGICMARASTKENKTIYQTTRESLRLTRESASDLLQCITPERIEKIENERTLPHPDEILVMAQKYRQPSLCNYYCANQCPIGQQYVPEVKIKDLSQIVLEMLASLNAMQKKKDRLIEITADGRISGNELEDFIYIQEELERISVAVETLQLWSEKMLATGAIDPEAYRAYKEKQS